MSFSNGLSTDTKVYWSMWLFTYIVQLLCTCGLTMNCVVGHDKIKEEMQLCSTPQNIDDVSDQSHSPPLYLSLTHTHHAFFDLSLLVSQINHIVGWARNSFTVLAILDYPYESDFYAPFTLPPYPVHFSCQLLLDAKSRLRGLAQAAGTLRLAVVDNYWWCSYTLPWQ